MFRDKSDGCIKVVLQAVTGARSVLIVGGSSGIGLATAIRLAQRR